MSDYLAQLATACKCEVSVTINQHRNYYETVAQYVQGRDLEPSAETLQRMIELNTVVEVQVYPDTPIGFLHVIHWDIDTALRLACEAVGRGDTR